MACGACAVVDLPGLIHAAKVNGYFATIVPLLPIYAAVLPVNLMIVSPFMTPVLTAFHENGFAAVGEVSVKFFVPLNIHSNLTINHVPAVPVWMLYAKVFLTISSETLLICPHPLYCA